MLGWNRNIFFLNRQARSPPSFWRPIDDVTFAPLFALSARDLALNADRYTSMRLMWLFVQMDVDGLVFLIWSLYFSIVEGHVDNLWNNIYFFVQNWVFFLSTKNEQR